MSDGRPFRFRLAGVLTIWQRREDAALATFRREQAATVAAQARVRELDAQYLDARSATASASADTSRHHDPAWHQNWIISLAQHLDEARAHVARCIVQETAARSAWQRTRRDRRVIERLRDRAQRRHREAVRQDEMKAMDERAIQGAFRREGLTW
jgi:flagellar export protein FliJ